MHRVHEYILFTMIDLAYRFLNCLDINYLYTYFVTSNCTWNHGTLPIWACGRTDSISSVLCLLPDVDMSL